jgi:hypothetical protein
MGSAPGQFDQPFDVGVVHVGDHRFDDDRGVDAGELRGGCVSLGEARGDVVLVEEDLSL